MSLHYEVVISCFLDDDTPASVLDTLRWLGDLDENATAGRHGPAHPGDFPYRTLRPDPDSRLPGGEVARLRRQVRGFTDAGDVVAWGFHARTCVLDDDMGEIYRILELIAPYVSGDGYGGHEREEHDAGDISLYLFTAGTVEVRRKNQVG